MMVIINGIQVEVWRISPPKSRKQRFRCRYTFGDHEINGFGTSEQEAECELIAAVDAVELREFGVNTFGI